MSSQGNGDAVQAEGEPTLADDLLSLFRLLYDPTEALRVLFSEKWPGLLFTLLFIYLVAPATLLSLSETHHFERQVFLALQRFIAVTPEEFVRIGFWFGASIFAGAAIVLGMAQFVLLRIAQRAISFPQSIATFAYALFPVFAAATIRWLALAVFDHSSPDGVLSQEALNAINALSGFVFLLGLYALAVWWKGIRQVSTLPPQKVALLITILIGLIVLPVLAVGVAVDYKQNHPEPSTSDVEYLFDSLGTKRGPSEPR